MALILAVLCGMVALVAYLHNAMEESNRVDRAMGRAPYTGKDGWVAPKPAQTPQTPQTPQTSQAQQAPQAPLAGVNTNPRFVQPGNTPHLPRSPYMNALPIISERIFVQGKRELPEEYRRSCAFYELLEEREKEELPDGELDTFRKLAAERGFTKEQMDFYALFLKKQARYPACSRSHPDYKNRTSKWNTGECNSFLYNWDKDPEPLTLAQLRKHIAPLQTLRKEAQKLHELRYAQRRYNCHVRDTSSWTEGGGSLRRYRWDHAVACARVMMWKEGYTPTCCESYPETIADWYPYTRTPSSGCEMRFGEFHYAPEGEWRDKNLADCERMEGDPLQKGYKQYHAGLQYRREKKVSDRAKEDAEGLFRQNVDGTLSKISYETA